MAAWSTWLAVLISCGCVAASVRRLVFAVSTTAIDPMTVLGALRRDRAAWREIREEIVADLHVAWEREWLEAMDAEGDARTALVNEQLGELEYRAERWGRVPRVCASVASSAGFLLASLALLAGLSAEDANLNDVAVSAVNSVAVGLAGAAFCVTLHVRARAIVRERLAAVDKLVERLGA